MRRLLVLLVLATIAGGLASSATAGSADGTFRVYFSGKAQNAHPCATDFFVCGDGAFESYGPATTTVAITGFTHGWDANGCLGITFEQTIVLADGSGSATLAESGDLCAPSPAAAALPLPGLIHTFGAPYRANLTYTVSSGTGVFAGSHGTGAVTLWIAGESGTARVTGTL